MPGSGQVLRHEQVRRRTPHQFGILIPVVPPLCIHASFNQPLDYPLRIMTDRAGTPAQPDDLVDVARLITAYYTEHPEPTTPDSRSVSAHPGTGAPVSRRVSTTITSLRRLRRSASTGGAGHRRAPADRPGHPRSVRTLVRHRIEVLVANDVTVLVDADDGFVPTPAISHAILTLNAQGRKADGIVVTPSQTLRPTVALGTTRRRRPR